MSKMNLLSDQIRIFPFTKDRGVDPFGRHLNEQNLRNMVRHMTDYDSFFIGLHDITTTYDKQNGSKSDMGNVYKECEFFIGGHYVNFIIELVYPDSASDESNIFWLQNHIYAEILHYEAADITSGATYAQLQGTDTSDVNQPRFEGVKFVSLSDTDLSDTDANSDTYNQTRNIILNQTFIPSDGSVAVSGCRKTILKIFNPICTSIPTTKQGLIELDNEMISKVPHDAFKKFDANAVARFDWGTF